MISGGVTRFKKLFITLAVIGLFVPALSQAATLSELLNQQNQLKNEQQKKEQQLKQKRAEEANLENAIDDLEEGIGTTQNRIANTQSQIDITNQVLAKLNEEITQEQGELDKLQEKLRVAYIALYELSRTSSTEQLAQGDNVSDIVSHSMYVQAIQDQLQDDIAKSSNILADLNSKRGQSEKQKQDLDGLKSRLASDKAYLDRQRNQKEGYLAATKRDEAKLQQDLLKLEQQRENLDAAIYEARRRAGGYTTGGTGGYPYTGSCGGVDPWLFYKCQCTSYAAWAFLRETGIVFYNTRPGQGSAWNWPALAQDQSLTVVYDSRGGRVGDIASWNKGQNMPYGHVAMVRAMYNGGATMDVEEYNYVAPERYSYRRGVSTAGVRFIRP